MHSRQRRGGKDKRLVELGVASLDTLGLPVADIPEPMGFWPKTGLSDR